MNQAAVRRIALALLLFGIVLRVRALAVNAAFWQDEAAVAINIANRSFAELARPLDHEQVAPVGFLWLVKASSLVFGGHEWALRLPACLSGVAGLLLVHALVRRSLAAPAALAALFLIVITRRLILYSAELKPYSTDLAVAAAIMLLAVIMLQRHADARSIAALAVCAAGGVWLSFPAVFVMGGAVLVLGVHLVMTRRWRTAGCVVVAGLACLASAMAHARLIAPVRESHYLQEFWLAKRGFMPWNEIIASAAWPARAMYDLFGDPMKAGYPPLAATCCVIGYLLLLQRRPADAFGSSPRGPRTRLVAVLLLSPIPLGLLAGAVHGYPFQGRLMLYLAPALAVGMAACVGFLACVPSRLSRLAAVMVFVALTAESTGRAFKEFAFPRLREEVRPIMRFIAEHRQPGDVVYVFATDLAWRYYAPRMGLTEVPVIVCEQGKPENDALLRRVLGRSRVWFFFGHASVTQDEDHPGLDYHRLYRDYLDRRGTRLAECIESGAAVDLYDLGQNSN